MSSSVFAAELQARAGDRAGRRWLFVPYDQLTDALGPLAAEAPESLGIVLIENPDKAARRPYHKQKLALVLTNLRHFALEQAERGVAVDYRVGPYAATLRAAAEEHGTLRCMRPAERELRRELEPLVEDELLELVPHEGWLTTSEQFTASQKPGARWRMDAFYRQVRRDSGLLMDDDGKPEGGKFSFDAHNRETWKGDPPAPEPPRFEPDAITREVIELVETRFADHPGVLDPQNLPASRDDTQASWEWAKEECLPFFGPYEDAMSTRSRTLFHTLSSSLIHLHRLLPRVLVEEVAALDVELRCREGFVRQVLGWREFMRHVHEQTDGFRDLPEALRSGDPSKDLDAPATPSLLGADQPLPPAYWGTPSGLACLDDVVAGVWETGYSHHITRLMVLSNIASLLDLSPRELTDWFWVAYTDAYDWVVEPNVLAMGTFAVGDLLTTKPYVSGGAYIDKMSDSCAGCRFHPKKDCPITSLYWAFLERHKEQLQGNQRLRMPYASLRKRAPEKRAADAATFDYVRETLAAGEVLTPDGRAAAVS